MADDDIRVCPYCRHLYMEDSSSQLDPDICPRCGGDLAAYCEDRGEDE